MNADAVYAAKEGLTPSRGRISTLSNLVHGSLGPIESATQTASRSVQPFGRPRPCAQQTTCAICRNRPHLCNASNVA